ncbi:MAG TPA: hypothetical protein VH092_21340 [Urbifossiella sp.]|nr:hypothetical protein [Urbifossiella sp.]
MATPITTSSPAVTSRTVGFFSGEYFPPDVIGPTRPGRYGDLVTIRLVFPGTVNVPSVTFMIAA